MKKIGLLLFTLLILPFGFVSPAFAQTNIQSGESVVLPRDQVVDKDYFAAGQSVTLSGTVNGDAYLAGGKIVIEGTVNGDLLVAGGEIDITGNVAGNVRAAGGQINASGIVGRNLTVAGGDVAIANSAQIAGNLVTGSGNLSIYGPIQGDITAGVGQALIGSRIGGDINAGVGKLVLTPNAQIGGDITYLSEEAIDQQPGASVSGQVVQNTPPQAPRETAEDIARFFAGIALAWTVLGFLASLAIGLLLIKFLPIFTKQALDLTFQKPWTAFGVGLLAMVLLPILFVILLITIIGIPIAFVLLFLYILGVFVAGIFGALLTGRLVSNWTSRDFSLGWTLVIGLVVLMALGLIPGLGSFVSFVATVFGFGALLMAKSSIYKQLRDKRLI